MIRVGFTGTQVGMTGRQLGGLRDILGELTESFGSVVGHHGDCVGSDAQFHILVRRIGGSVVGHPPLEPRKRAWCVCDSLWPEKGYLVRNRDIVMGVDRMIAAPKEHVEVLRSGTWATIRETMRAEKKLYVVWPNGSITRRNM